MGAEIFSQLIVAKGTARDAITKARQESNDYNGHQDGYSGDIQTCDEFTEAYKHPRYGTKAFYAWEEKQLDNMDKRECKYVVINGAVGKRIKENYGYKGRKGLIVVYFFGWGAC